MREALGSLSGHTLARKKSKIIARPAMGAVELTDVTVTDYNPLTVLSAGISAIGAAVTGSAAGAGDNVTTTADGSGSITTADFKNVGGVCKPMNFPALNFAKAFQAQMNRVAQMKGWSKVGVDGAIGPGTMALFGKIAAAYPTLISANTSSCAYVAADSDVWAGVISGIADSLGAPTEVTAPASGAATIVTKSGKTVIAPPPGAASASAINAFDGMSSGQKLVFAGLLGGIGYVIVKKSKKSKRKGG